MLRIVGLVLASLSLNASAGAVVEDVPRGRLAVTGQGLASASAEQAKMYVVVTSICYDTARAAKNANAMLANRMVKLLQGYVTTTEDTVTATGGSLERQTETIWVDGEQKTICERKWRTSNTLVLLVHKFDTLPDIQDSVIAAIEAAGELDPQKKAQTYAEASQPFFSVKAATDARLRREAQVAAYDDAKAQFNAFASRCPFQDVHLTVIAPPTYKVERPSAEAMEEASSELETPIIPDQIRVSAQWQFEWSYIAPSTCPR
jgi:uncharacterized protein YggE